MGIKKLEYKELLEVFENDKLASEVLDTWRSSCREFRESIEAKLEQTFLYEKDCNKKHSEDAEKISKLQQDIAKTKSDIDDAILQQKVIDKKISNMRKMQEETKDDLEKAKKQKEALSLELVDLELEVDKRKQKKLTQWDALKRACNQYKNNLDIHLSLQEEKDCQYVKLSFFTHNEATKDKYFVQLSNSDNHWKVEQIEPRLKKEHLKELTSIKDSSECSKVSDITLFLCEIRSIYLKYYMKT